MKISATLNQVAEALDVWAKGKGGVAEVAGDPLDLLAMLQHKPGGVRVAVLFAGETKRGEFEEASMVDRNFSVVISRGRALSLVAGDSLTKGAAGGPPLFDLAEEARDLIRALSFSADTTEVTPNYLGTETFSVDGKAIDAYQLNFQIGTQLPAPEPEP